MSFWDDFWGSGGAITTLGSSEIQEIFSVPVLEKDFKKSDILTTYTKILTDVVERTNGLTKKYEPTLWDSCVQSEAKNGLVTLLATAMAEKSELFIVFDKATNVLRKADFKEQEEIRKDYKEKAQSSKGVFVSFKDYLRTDMLLIYSCLEYYVLSSLHKTLNISKAVQVKIDKMRQGIAVADSQIAIDQAKSIASALRKGMDVMLDKNDEITTATPDTGPTEKAIQFLDAKRAFTLGLPIAYVSGLQTPGIGSTGEADMRAVERGLKQYFVSIIQPVFKAVYGNDVEFVSQDFRQMTTALEVLRTFDLVSDENMPREMKVLIIARVFELDVEELKKILEKEEKEREKEIEENGGQDPNATDNEDEQDEQDEEDSEE